MTARAFDHVYQALLALVDYAQDRGLIGAEDRAYAANQLLDALRLEADDSFDPLERAFAEGEVPPLEGVLAALLDTRLMGCVTPRPSEVVRGFWERYEEAPKEATDWFYQLALSSDYIRSYRVARDRKWKAPTPYGELDITINLSKPEKHPSPLS
ncbi:MAG: hypothetical protein E7Z98_08500 [Olsenella sp.]|nr:hypothetical protein [Olsenella sp.]